MGEIFQRIKAEVIDGYIIFEGSFEDNLKKIGYARLSEKYAGQEEVKLKDNFTPQRYETGGKERCATIRKNGTTEQMEPTKFKDVYLYHNKGTTTNN